MPGRFPVPTKVGSERETLVSVQGRRRVGQRLFGALPVELRRLAPPAGFEPATSSSQRMDSDRQSALIHDVRGDEVFGRRHCSIHLSYAPVIGPSGPIGVVGFEPTTDGLHAGSRPERGSGVSRLDRQARTGEGSPRVGVSATASRIRPTASRRAAGPSLSVPQRRWDRIDLAVIFFTERWNPTWQLGERCRWESNPLQPVCSRSPGRLAPASFARHVLARSRTWPSTFAGLRALPHTPRTSMMVQRNTPPGSRTRPRGFEGRRAVQHTRGECPRQESNLVRDLRRVACESVTLQGPGIIKQSDGRSRTGIGLLCRKPGSQRSNE